jgi:hypothetical protein
VNSDPDGDAVIAWIRKKEFKNLKMPRGNEPGANKNWLPGGYTGGGCSEAIWDISDSTIPYERYPF